MTLDFAILESPIQNPSSGSGNIEQCGILVIHDGLVNHHKQSFKEESFLMVVITESLPNNLLSKQG